MLKIMWEKIVYIFFYLGVSFFDTLNVLLLAFILAEVSLISMFNKGKKSIRINKKGNNTKIA